MIQTAWPKRVDFSIQQTCCKGYAASLRIAAGLILSWEALTDRAKMCAALPDENALHRCAAGITCFSGALVHLEIILETAAAIDPVNTGAVAADAFFQHLTHCLPQALAFRLAETVRAAQRMKFRQVQGFIGVDVTHSGQEMLVEQQGLQLALVGVQALIEGVCVEIICQRFGTERAEQAGGVVCQPNPSEFARVNECQPLAAGEVEDCPVMFLQGDRRAQRICVRSQAQIAAHPQMDDEGILIEVDEEMFTAPPQAMDDLPW